MKDKLGRAKAIIYRNKPYKLWSDSDVSEFSDLCGDDLVSIYRGLDPKVYARSEGKTNVAEILQEYPDVDDKRMNCLFVKKVGGEIERRYKWKGIITGKIANKESRIKKMMRDTVSHQLRAFKQESIQGFGSTCYQCGCETNDLHVDHMFPPISHMIGSWIDENGFPETKESVLGGGCVFAHEDDERSWQENHAEICTLQMLCSQCNIRKSDKITITGMTLSALMQDLFSVPSASIYKRYE